MLTYLCLMALLPFPTWEYKIKVEGKLDIGNQIAGFLKEIRARVLEQKMRSLGQGRPEESKDTTEIKITQAVAPVQEKKVDKKKAERKKANKKKADTRQGPTFDQSHSILELSHKGEEDFTLLDDMIKKGQNKMHLYGTHKSEEATERNKVDV